MPSSRRRRGGNFDMRDFGNSVGNFCGAPNVHTVNTLAARFDKKNFQYVAKKCLKKFLEANGVAALHTVVSSLTSSKQTTASQTKAFRACGLIVTCLFRHSSPKSQIRQQLVESGVLEVLLESCVSLRDEVAGDADLTAAVDLLRASARLHLDTTDNAVMTAHLDAEPENAAKFCSVFESFFAQKWGAEEVEMLEATDQLARVQTYLATSRAKRGPNLLIEDPNIQDRIFTIINSLPAEELSTQVKNAVVRCCLNIFRSCAGSGNNEGAPTFLTAKQQHELLNVVHRVSNHQAQALAASLFRPQLAGVLDQLPKVLADLKAKEVSAPHLSTLLMTLSVLTTDESSRSKFTDRYGTLLEIYNLLQDETLTAALSPDEKARVIMCGSRLSEFLLTTRGCPASEQASVTDSQIGAQLGTGLQHLALLLSQNVAAPVRALVQQTRTEVLASLSRMSTVLDPRVLGEVVKFVVPVLTGSQSEFQDERTVVHLMQLMSKVPVHATAHHPESVVKLAQLGLVPLEALRQRRLLHELVACIHPQHRSKVVEAPNAIQTLHKQRPDELLEICTPATFARAAAIVEELKLIADAQPQQRVPSCLDLDATLLDVHRERLLVQPKERRPESTLSTVAGHFYSSQLSVLKQEGFLTDEVYDRLFQSIADLDSIRALRDEFLTRDKAEACMTRLQMALVPLLMGSGNKRNESVTWTVAKAEAVQKVLVELLSFGRLNPQLLVEVKFPDVAFHCLGQEGFPLTGRFEPKSQGTPGLRAILDMQFQTLRTVVDCQTPPDFTFSWCVGALEQILRCRKQSKLLWFLEPCQLLEAVLRGSPNHGRHNSQLVGTVPDTLLAGFCMVLQQLDEAATQTEFDAGAQGTTWFKLLESSAKGTMHLLYNDSAQETIATAAPQLLSERPCIARVLQAIRHLLWEFDCSAFAPDLLLCMTQIVASAIRLLSQMKVLADTDEYPLLAYDDAWGLCKRVLEQFKNTDLYPLAVTESARILAASSFTVDTVITSIDQAVQLLTKIVAPAAPETYFDILGTLVDGLWQLDLVSSVDAMETETSFSPSKVTVQVFVECLAQLERIRAERENATAAGGSSMGDPKCAAIEPVVADFIWSIFRGAVVTRPEAIVSFISPLLDFATNHLQTRFSLSAASFVSAAVSADATRSQIDGKTLQMLASQFERFVRVPAHLESLYAGPVCHGSMPEHLQYIEEFLSTRSGSSPSPEVTADTSNMDDDSSSDVEMPVPVNWTLLDPVPSIPAVVDRDTEQFVLEDPDALTEAMQDAAAWLKQGAEDVRLHVEFAQVMVPLVFNSANGIASDQSNLTTQSTFDVLEAVAPFVTNLEGQLDLFLSKLRLKPDIDVFECVSLSATDGLLQLAQDEVAVQQVCDETDGSVLEKLVRYLGTGIQTCCLSLAHHSRRHSAIAIGESLVRSVVIVLDFVSTPCERGLPALLRSKTLAQSLTMAAKALSHVVFVSRCFPIVWPLVLRALAQVSSGKVVGDDGPALRAMFSVVDSAVMLYAGGSFRWLAHVMQPLLAQLIALARRVDGPGSTDFPWVRPRAMSCLAKVVAAQVAHTLRSHNARTRLRPFGGRDTLTPVSSYQPNLSVEQFSLLLRTTASFIRADVAHQSHGSDLISAAVTILTQLCVYARFESHRNLKYLNELAGFANCATRPRYAVAILEAATAQSLRPERDNRDMDCIASVSGCILQFCDSFVVATDRVGGLSQEVGRSTQRATEKLAMDRQRLMQERAVVRGLSRCWHKLLESIPVVVLASNTIRPTFASSATALRNLIALGVFLSRRTEWANILRQQVQSGADTNYEELLFEFFTSIGKGKMVATIGRTIGNNRGQMPKCCEALAAKYKAEMPNTNDCGYPYADLAPRLLELARLSIGARAVTLDGPQNPKSERPSARSSGAQLRHEVLHGCLLIFANLLSHNQCYSFFRERFLLGTQAPPMHLSETQRRKPSKDPIIPILADVLRCSGDGGSNLLFPCASVALSILECCVVHAHNLACRQRLMTREQAEVDDGVLQSTLHLMVRGLQRCDTNGALIAVRALHVGRSELFVLQVKLVHLCLDQLFQEVNQLCQT